MKRWLFFAPGEKGRRQAGNVSVRSEYLRAVELDGFDVLTRLGESSDTELYRAVRARDGLPVLLRLLKPEAVTARKLAGMKRELELVGRLALAGSQKVLAFEHSRVGWMLVLEDIGGDSLEGHLGSRKLPLVEVLQLAVRIADALEDIHRSGVTHSSIQPANVYWNPETRAARIGGFGLASALPEQSQGFASPSVLEGALEFMAPEQTGRMNRAVDSRADLYSFGATLYAALTGSPPFTGDDPVELVHGLIARNPVPPHERDPLVPLPVSRIVMRLLEKNAEDRYQTARGLERDLRRCLARVEVGACVEPFELGREDDSPSLRMPQALYGREEPERRLLRAFERASGGRAELFLVAGSTGVGKTALVHEIYRSVTLRRGHFVEGKFDQYQHEAPYQAWDLALSALAHQLLTEPAAQLDARRAKLERALEGNGRVLTDIVPALERVLGPQPPVPALAGAEAQNRFNRVFQAFVRSIAAAQHPLVVFLDDLQWADPASLRLIQALLTDSTLRHFLLIGAHRDSEVGPSHPLTRAVEELERQDVVVERETLQPLSIADVHALLADALKRPRAGTAALAELIHAKAGGNPFFTRQIMHALEKEGLLRFAPAPRRWVWDLEAIRSHRLTDNVIDVLSDRFRLLPRASQHLLRQAACIGHRFNLEMLSLLAGVPLEQARAELLPAVEQDLLILSAGELAFAHDRVQQAAYSLIPERERLSTHWRIGELLLRDPERRDARLFDIVNQLNLGASLGAPTSVRSRLSPAEALRLGDLNQEAGRKAMAASAFSAALRYFEQGIASLGEEGWHDDLPTATALHQQATAAAQLCGEYERMRALGSAVRAHARSTLDEVPVDESEIRALTAQGQLLPAIRHGLRALERLGMHLPEEPGEGESRRRLEATLGLLEQVTVEGILTLPEMTSAEHLAQISILSQVGEPAYAAAPGLFIAWASRMAETTLRHGNCALSPFAFAAFALALCASEEHVETGYRLAKAAMCLMEQRKAEFLKCRVLNIFGCTIQPWMEPLRQCIPVLEEAVSVGAATGDFTSGSYSSFNTCSSAFFMGEPLGALEQRIARSLETIASLRQTYIRDWVEVWGLTVRRLRGPEAATGSAELDEARWLAAARAASDRCGLAYYFLGKLVTAYLLGEERTEEYAAEVLENFAGFQGAFAVPVFYFYDSLALLQRARSATREGRVRENQRKLLGLARLAPMNFQHKHDLVQAELARSEGDDWEAARLYERAIHGARRNRFLHEEGLACERAGRFYLERGMEEAGRLHLARARDCFADWQGTAGVRRLEALLPAAGSERAGATAVGPAVDRGLDVRSLMKAAQAISREIDLEKLLAALVTIASENAGARYGALVLETAGRWLVRAQRSVEEPRATELQPIELEQCDRVAGSIVRFVARSGEPVILADAARDRVFERDAHVQRHRCRSVLCAPVRSHGRTVGVLYLENDVAAGAFTPERLQVLEMLVAQAATSLENAEAYRAMRDSEARYRRIVDTADEGIWMVGPDMLTTFVNVRMAEMLGRSREELLGQPVTDFMFEEDVADHLKKMAERRQRVVGTYERRFRHRDGHVVWTLASAVPSFDDEGGFQGSFAMFTDITKRKRAEEAVLESEQRLALLIENAPVAIVTHGTDGRILSSNAVSRELLGLSEQQMHGRRSEDSAWHFFREDGTRMPVDEYPISQVLARRQPLKNAVVGLLKPGADRIAWMLVNAVPLLDREGRLREIIVMFLDISGRKRMEEELKETARRKDEFISMLGHELRNPLAPIQNANYVLKLLGLPDPRARRAQEMIERQVLHITRIVDDLLDVSRVERGKLTLQMQQVDLVQVVRTTVEDLRGEFEAHGLVLSASLPGQNVRVLGDATRLAQVLSNLLVNAAKFTDRGGRVLVQLEAPAGGGGGVTLRVQDTGIGMTPQTLERLFTPFVQAEMDIARSRGGLGLGLALVKGLVNLHGGTVQAASEGLGRGSTFTVWLPASVEQAAEQRAAPGLSKAKELSVLVIEDNADASKSLQLLLELMGHAVRTAPDGVAGLAAARAFKPDVVVCDIGLPGAMDGYAVARAIRADPSLRSARLLALTGYGKATDKQLAKEAGFDSHMTKPANPPLLEQFLQGETSATV